MARKFISDNPSDKYYKDKEGNPNLRYNKRTMMKKAYQAFLQGRTSYTYKGETFMVPFTTKK